MRKNIFQKQILQQDIKMDTSSSFMANGDINIYPCPWESDKQVTPNGKRVWYRGGIEVEPDGRTHMKRYNEGQQGPKYQTIFETAHGEMKMTRKRKRRYLNREKVVISFKFPRKYPLSLMKRLYEEETEQMMAFLNTRKEETLWKD